MYDVSAQYHKDELAKKQLLEEIISSVGTSTTSIVSELQSINSDIVLYGAAIDTSIQNQTIDIRDVLTNTSQTTQIVPTSTPTNLTLTESAVVTNGNTASDNLYVTFITSSDFTGTINGVSIPNLAVKNYPYLPGYKYPAISYTVTAGTLYIIQAK